MWSFLNKNFPRISLFSYTTYKWLKQVFNPPLLRVLFKTFKIINLRKNSRHTSRETIEIDPSHLQEKWASSRQNSTQIAIFSSIIWVYFSSEPNLSFYFHSISILFQSLTQTFVCLKKVLDKYAKSGISLKYPITNCVLNFLICIMILIYEVYSTKKRHKGIQFLFNFKLVKLIFSRFSHIKLS